MMSRFEMGLVLKTDQNKNFKKKNKHWFDKTSLLYGPIAHGWAGRPGNLIVYLGSATGRDGVAGASFASVDLSEESENRKSAVQVGDPYQGKLVMEACLEISRSGLLVGMGDMGAAGLTSCLAEIAYRSRLGIELSLDLVPTTSADLTPYEIMLSESQERMILIVNQENLKDIKKIGERWDVNCLEIGIVTDSDNFVVKKKGDIVVNLPIDFLVCGWSLLGR